MIFLFQQILNKVVKYFGAAITVINYKTFVSFDGAKLKVASKERMEVIRMLLVVKKVQ